MVESTVLYGKPEPLGISVSQSQKYATTFFWTKYTFKHVYAYLLRLHHKTFHRLKYYFHAFTEYYNRNV